MSHLFAKLITRAQQVDSTLIAREDRHAQEHDELVQRWHRVTRAIIAHRNAPNQSYPDEPKRVSVPLLPVVSGRLEQLQPVAYGLHGSPQDNSAEQPYLFVTKSGRLVYQTRNGGYRYLTNVYAITDEDVDNMERALEPQH